MRIPGKLFVSLAPAMVLLLAPSSGHAGADAQALYAAKCQVCHSLAGNAGKMASVGGSLDGVGSKRDAEWLKKYLKDPKSVMPEAKMPAIKMTDAELDAMVAYMASQK